jgi:hypothetical protein
MLDMGRWKYDSKRCLSIYCRTPAEPDDKLRDYLVSPEVAREALDPYVYQNKKRKRNVRDSLAVEDNLLLVSS